MSKITQSARDEECQVRLIGICNHNPETTVFAHIRLKGNCGMGIKPRDMYGVYACSACHDEIDRRTRKLDKDLVLTEALHGMIRTQEILIQKGLIKEI